MTPADQLLKKILVASSIPSTEWEKIRVGLRDRAFFSSRIESLKFLAESRKTIADMLAGAQTERGTITTREDAIRTIRESATRLGLKKTGTSALTDPTSRARAAVIVDTNAGLAAGYVRHEQNMSLGSRAAFPAQEFVRVRRSEHPRLDWPERWVRAGGKMFSGRMIALVEDDVWARLSRFGVPYPPFDYNSGMGTRMISRRESISLGVIDDDFKPAKTPVQKGLNDTLETEVDIGHWTSGARKNLLNIFGSQIKIQEDRNTGILKARWSGIDVRKIFTSSEPAGNGKITSMGVATNDLLSKCTPDLAERFRGKQCPLTRQLITHMKNHGHWPIELNKKTNLQIKEEELDLIPCMWRSPDRVVPGNAKRPGTAVLELDAFDGGTFCFVVDGYSQSLEPLTMYKRK